MKRRAKDAIRIIREGRNDIDAHGPLVVPTPKGDLRIGVGGGFASTPGDDFGPYTAVEVRYPGADESVRFEPADQVVQYIEDNAD